MQERNQKRSSNGNQKRNSSRSHNESQVKKGAAKRKRHSKARKNYIQNRVAIKSITIVVCMLLVILLFHGRSLQDKVKENEVKLSKLQEAYEEEQARTEEIEALQE